MEKYIIFHNLVQRDLTGIMRYYEQEAGEHLADRFYLSFINTTDKALETPKHFHPIEGVIRRADTPGFPYHFLYRETVYGIRILVLRHNKRRSSLGLRRK